PRATEPRSDADRGLDVRRDVGNRNRDVFLQEPPPGRGRRRRTLPRCAQPAPEQVLRRRDVRRVDRAADPDRVGRRAVEGCRRASHRWRRERRRRNGRQLERAAAAHAERFGADLRGVGLPGRRINTRILLMALTRTKDTKVTKDTKDRNGSGLSAFAYVSFVPSVS